MQRTPCLVANYRVGELSAGRFAAEEPVCAVKGEPCSDWSSCSSVCSLGAVFEMLPKVSLPPDSRATPSSRNRGSCS